MDAYLAAFAMESGLKYVTSDGAFASFAGLNPLILTVAAPSSSP
jgi:predicted nucleic acid-binding protein